MASKSSLLRNIRLSGGLFTENILLRLRDNPNQLRIGKIETFLEEETKESKKKFKQKKDIIFDWCVQKWDEISSNIDDWSKNDLTNKWLIPLFTLLDHDIEDFEIKIENIDEDSILKDFRISHQSKDHKNPFFQFVVISEDFDSNVNSNPLKRSHHNISQQFVNLNPEIKWIFLSNGRILRILTKYYHSYSNGYLEFDLENIFANRDLKEFEVLYTTIHASRFEPKFEDHEFLIDLFQKESVSEGIKIGDALRDNVHDALELLGYELIQENKNFQEKILAKEIDTQEYYAELLRIIYRIIFILYAEQREMLPGAGTIYFEQFSLSSLRILSERSIKVEKSYDLWSKLFLTFKLINEGNEFLGVNSYNGSLFNDKNLSIIIKKGLKISNDVLLKIIRLLTTSITINVRQRINFIEISEEEIGAIYESLLDYKPIIDSHLQFRLIEGIERKSTGTYYTPRALIDILIRTTLQQLVEDRLAKAGEDGKSRERAILDLKVCDPACGGGTFLLSALNFLGKKLAEVRTGSDSPLEKDLRDSRRDVLQHCIYGVDMNALAVELAKISLWLRACVNDKPLNFLDNHIRCGNSLLGIGQKIEIRSIEPNAFEAIKGNKDTGIPDENRKLRDMARKYIKAELSERKKQGKKITITSYFTEKRTADICSTKFQEIINMPEDTPAKIKEKERRYYQLRKNENYQQALDEANIWASTFFWSFEGDALGEIPRYTTIEQLREKIIDPELKNLMIKIQKIANENQFFHWYIEFPEVFSSISKGFDCFLTNPPWDVMEFKELEFFIGLNNEILSAPNQSKRRKLIKELQSKNPQIFDKYQNAWLKMKKTKQFLNNSGIFEFSSKGKLNSYALFAERCWKLISPDGRVGIICPTGIIMNYFMQDLFREFINKKSIISIFDFSNRKKLFNIDSHFRFCLLSLGGESVKQLIIPMTFYTLEPKEVQESLTIISENKNELKKSIDRLSDENILIPLEQEDFNLFNPNTLTCPSFKIKRDLKLLKHIYYQTPILVRRDPNSNGILDNPWDIRFNVLFNISSDSNLFYTQKQLEEMKAIPEDKKTIGGIWIDHLKKRSFYPLYTGKMIWLYDHRYQSEVIDTKRKQRSLKPISNSLEDHKNKSFFTIPAYWVEENHLKERIPEVYNKEFFLGFRDVVSTDNRRTFISTFIPKRATQDKIPLILSDKTADLLCCLLANFNSIVFDYVVRQKISGTSMSFFITEQLPVFPPEKYSPKLKKFILLRVVELVYTSRDLSGFANEIRYPNEPFEWDLEKRMKIQSELDALFALLYKLSKEDLKYIIETFDILERKELEEFNEYRTRKMILNAYDQLKEQEELFD